MFIVYIFMINIYISLVHGFTLRTKDNDNIENNDYTNFSTQKDSNKNEATTTQSDWQKFIQNLTYAKQSNLKSNVFDRMLSDEMLSIKEHFQKKDMTEVAPVQVTTGNYGPKPTLEVKQQWPLLKMLENINVEETTKSNANIKETTKISQNKDISVLKPQMSLSDKNTKEVKIKPKNLGLRSLPNNKCVCQRSTAHVCTDSQSPNNYHHGSCTRGCDTTPNEEISYYPIPLPIYTIPPYVIELGDLPAQYVGNEFKPPPPPPPPPPPKFKGSKKKYKDHVYYDEYVYYEPVQSKPKIVSDDNSEDYDADVNNVDENLVHSIVNDLEVFHQDSVVKKCYCSSISKSFPDYLSILFIFIYLFKVWLIGI